MRLGVAWAVALVTLLAGCSTEGARLGTEDGPRYVVVVETAATPAHEAEPSRAPVWPPGLEGPFALREMQRVQVASFDGVALDGWLFLPDVPPEVKLPAILMDDPYFGQLSPTPDLTFAGSRQESLLKAGYAIAMFSARGTGNSGGCWEVYGASERKDLALLVEWLAGQPWSNGRVGMFGMSYGGTTPLMAAVEAPPSLRAIAASAIDVDVYQLLYTPQGAGQWHAAPTPGAYWASESPLPPLRSSSPEHGTTEHADALADRACPAAAHILAGGFTAAATDDRMADLWTERRLTERAANVTIPVMVSFGIRDWQTHFQDGLLWAALERAPKRMYVGDWGHDHPWEHVGREGDLLAWFDHWLKDLGPPPAVGTVTFLDQLGGVRETTAWPPAEARLEALHLDGEALSRAPGDAARTYATARWAGGENNALWILGERTYDPALLLCAPGPQTLLYESEPVEAATLLAGAPFAHVALESTLPGGVVALALFDLAPEFACDGGAPSGAHLVSSGAADLRFHAGGFQGEPFPVRAATPVRIDLRDTVHTLEPGHTLVLAIGPGDTTGRGASPYAPVVTVHGASGGVASQLVLPVVEGTTGGAAPIGDLPPRPFHPATLSRTDG